MYNPTKAISRLYDLVDDAKFHRRVILQNPHLTDTVRTLALARNSAIVTQAKRALRDAQFQHARQRLEESADSIAIGASSALACFQAAKRQMGASGSKCSAESAYVDVDALGFGSGSGA